MNGQVTINDAAIRSPLVRWSELVSYRDFVFLLVWREIHLRYRHTAIGIGWALLNPLLTMAVFGLIIPNLMDRQTLDRYTGGLPYPLYVYCGVIPWTTFSHSLTRCCTSLVDQGALLKNMYFPRLALPLSKVLAALVELLIALAALFVLMAILRVPPSRNIVFLPLFFVPLVVGSLGTGLLLSLLQVRYRDVFFVLQFGIQLGMLVTPVWFPLEALPPSVRWAVALNPMTAVVQGFRWALIGVTPPKPEVLASSALSCTVLLLAGLLFFRQRQETIADHV